MAQDERPEAQARQEHRKDPRLLQTSPKRHDQWHTQTEHDDHGNRHTGRKDNESEPAHEETVEVVGGCGRRDMKEPQEVLRFYIDFLSLNLTRPISSRSTAHES